VRENEQISFSATAMANEFCEILLTDKPLQTSARADFKPDAGAVVEFFGVVRGVEDGEKIDGIFYEAHREMARHQLEKIAQAAREKFVCAEIVLHHRVGFVPIAEPSLFLRVSAKHRGAALAACAWIIDELKTLAPIWKHPRFSKHAEIFQNENETASTAAPQKQ